MKHKHIILSFLVVLFASIGAVPAVQAADKLVFNTGTREPFTAEGGTGFLDLLVKEVYGRLGIDAEVIVYGASARALQHANDGIDDGAVLRIKGLEKKYPNLVRVPEKIMDNDFVAYSTGKNVETADWRSLDDYSIAYILGWQIFQNNLGHHTKIDKVKDVQQMFSLLKEDRVDFILYERWQGLWWASRLGVNVKVQDPPLAKMEMFMYLHIKHADLVDKAADALRAMKADGTYQAIFDKVLTPLADGN